MSVMRISSVGKRTLGRTSHHSLLPSSITPASISAFRCRSIFAEAVELLGQAGARQLVEHGHAVGFEAGILAAPERRGGAERQQVRQEIGDLAHEIDAQLRVLDADMDMHAADHEPPRRAPGDRGPACCSVPCRCGAARSRRRRDGSRRQSAPDRTARRSPQLCAAAARDRRALPRPNGRRRCRPRSGSAGIPASPGSSAPSGNPRTGRPAHPAPGPAICGRRGDILPRCRW